MSGMMSNIQYMPSPHGVSKRIRLHHNELFPNPFQGIGHYGYPYHTKEQNDIEVYKTTHIWMRNCQFKDERNALLLVSGCDGFGGKLTESSTSGFQCLKENSIWKDLASEISKDNSVKPLFPKQFNGTFKDAVVQSLSFLESDLQNSTEKETTEPAFVPKESNLQNGCEDPNCLSVENESKFASTTEPNGTKKFDSSAVLRSHFETSSEDKLSGPIDEPTNGKYTPDHLDNSDISKDSSRKYDKSVEYKNGTDVTKTFKCNQYQHDTSKDSSVVHYGYKNHSLKSTTNLSEYSKSVDSKDNQLCNVKKSSRVIDITTKGFEEHKVDNHIIKESDNDHKLGDSLSVGKFQAKNANFLKPGIKVLSWKTYAEIVRRLPDYKVFSGVIQKAMKKVKHPKIDFEPISPEESTQSNTTLSALIENVKATEELNESFKVTELELRENVKVTEELHESFKVAEFELPESFRVTEQELHKNFKVTEESHENSITNSKQVLLLNDLEESYDFLDFTSGKIQEMVLLISSTSQDIKTLEAESEVIVLALHHIQNMQYIEKTERKFSIGDFNAITSTRSEILKLGDHILQKIESLEQSWMAVLTTFKINLAVVSRSVYMLCSVPIECKLTDQRDLVYEAMKKVDDQIIKVEVKEKDLNSQRNCQFSELLELQGEIGRFHRLDTILNELCQKRVD